jgi:hypothetical protein
MDVTRNIQPLRLYTVVADGEEPLLLALDHSRKLGGALIGVWDTPFGMMVGPAVKLGQSGPQDMADTKYLYSVTTRQNPQLREKEEEE